ncbi:MAG: hypothetical protein LBI15_11960 [Dysgonamonadaceae bacterium]|nr:hypothetical protein [Dysgonamonadaceae bacterium]
MNTENQDNSCIQELSQDICLSELYLPPANDLDSLAMLLIAKVVDIPVGNNLVLNTFEDKWENIGREVDERSDSEKWLLDLRRHFRTQYDFDENSSTMIDRKYFRSLFNITSCLPDIRNSVLNGQFGVIAINVAKYQNFTLYSFLTDFIELDCIYCDNGEFIQIQSLVSISNGRVIDNLIVAYTYSDGAGGGSSQYFYYDGKLIHIKGFGNIEWNWTGFTDYQKYQITSHGRFIQIPDN